MFFFNEILFFTPKKTNFIVTLYFSELNYKIIIYLLHKLIFINKAPILNIIIMKMGMSIGNDFG